MNDSITVRELAPADDALHVDFLDRLATSSPSVLGYHYPFHRGLLTQEGIGTPLYLGAFQSDDLVGILPGFLKSAPSGTVYCSMPYFGPNAGVLCANDENAPAIHNALISAALERLRDHDDALAASFYTPFLMHDYAPYDTALPGAMVIDKFTNYIDLSAFELNRSIAWDVRKAEKSDVTITTEVSPDLVDTFYDIYKTNCADYSIPLKSKGVIEYLLTAPDRDDHVRSYFAHREGCLIAGLITVSSPSTMSYWVPCGLHEARNYQPGTALIARAIADAQASGVRYWNWESSPSRDSGVYKFKTKWGGHETDYRTYVLPLRDSAHFAELGQERIAADFPWFFVFPFDRL